DARYLLENGTRVAALDPDARRRLAEAFQADARFVQLMHRGRHAEAERVAREALESRRTILGEQHLDVAHSTNEVGVARQAGGDSPKAQAFFGRARPLFSGALGEEPPPPAIVPANLATVAQAQGKPAEARRLLTRAGAVLTPARGDDHPDVATLSN